MGDVVVLGFGLFCFFFRVFVYAVICLKSSFCFVGWCWFGFVFRGGSVFLSLFSMGFCFICILVSACVFFCSESRFRQGFFRRVWCSRSFFFVFLGWFSGCRVGSLGLGIICKIEVVGDLGWSGLSDEQVYYKFCIDIEGGTFLRVFFRVELRL